MKEENNQAMYMNPNTGSVDTLNGWYPYTEKDGLIEVIGVEDEYGHGAGRWIEVE